MVDELNYNPELENWKEPQEGGTTKWRSLGSSSTYTRFDFQGHSVRVFRVPILIGRGPGRLPAAPSVWWLGPGLSTHLWSQTSSNQGSSSNRWVHMQRTDDDMPQNTRSFLRWLHFSRYSPRCADIRFPCVLFKISDLYLLSPNWIRIFCWLRELGWLGNYIRSFGLQNDTGWVAPTLRSSF